MLYRGWRLENWEFFGILALGIYGGLLPRGSGSWGMRDFAPDLFRSSPVREANSNSVRLMHSKARR